MRRAANDYGSTAVYGLIGWELGDWRIAARLDEFRTRNNSGSPPDEDGDALTGDVSWLPNEWLRLSAELLHIDSKRNEREAGGIDPRQTEAQGQLMARIYL